jgi:hypothetical protein
VKKVATTILVIPFALAGGLIYGLIADKIFREREPWFTLSMLCGLCVSVCAMTWLTGASRTAGAWVFVGTGILYIALRLLFGRRSALEMFYTPHFGAIMLLLLLPTLTRARVKASQPCWGKLVNIDAAKDQWAVETSATSGTPVTVEIIIPYLRVMPTCHVTGATYIVGNVGAEPRCTVHGTVSHFQPDRY